MYTGPRKRLAYTELSNLPSHWALQPKIDGCYAAAYCDRDGCVIQLLARSGRPIEDSVHRLRGMRISTSWAIVVGELEAHSERGVSAAHARGLPHFHLFDALELGGRRLSHVPYASRRDLLYRAWGRTDGSSARTAVVAQYDLHRGPALWDQVQAGLLEGLVAVDRRAAAGVGKMKIKPRDYADCAVLACNDRLAVLRHPDGYAFRVGCKGRGVVPGDVWEVSHEGHYQSGKLRFPALLRRRDDIRALVPRTPGQDMGAIGKVLRFPCGG